MNELTIGKVDEKRDELFTQLIDMAQLKSDFDAEKFTAMKKGPFVAHQFHFIMRQYSLALYEAKRVLIDREKNNREIKELNHKKTKDYDLEILKLENDNYMLELTLRNQMAKINNFENLRLKLIEKNGGKAPTNEEYQKEEPDFWKWEISRQAREEVNQRLTGVSKGVYEAIAQIEADPVLNLDFKREILNNGQLDLKKLTESVNAQPNAIEDKTEEVKQIDQKDN